MAATNEQVLRDVNRLVNDVLDNQSIVLKPDTSAQDVKEWDSLNHIVIVVAIEKHFNVKFNFAELQRFKNVGEMCDNIALKLAQRRDA